MYLLYSLEENLVKTKIPTRNNIDVIGEYSLKYHLKWLFSHLILVPSTAQSIWTRLLRTSLCSLSGLSLPSRPHSLFLFQPLQHKNRNISLLPAQTVSAKEGPLPGKATVWRHRTVPPNPGLVNPESFTETSRSAGALDQYCPTFNGVPFFFTPKCVFQQNHNLLKVI